MRYKSVRYQYMCGGRNSENQKNAKKYVLSRLFHGILEKNGKESGKMIFSLRQEEKQDFREVENLIREALQMIRKYFPGKTA